MPTGDVRHCTPGVTAIKWRQLIESTSWEACYQRRCGAQSDSGEE